MNLINIIESSYEHLDTYKVSFLFNESVKISLPHPRLFQSDGMFSF